MVLPQSQPLPVGGETSAGLSNVELAAAAVLLLVLSYAVGRTLGEVADEHDIFPDMTEDNYENVVKGSIGLLLLTASLLVAVIAQLTMSGGAEIPVMMFSLGIAFCICYQNALVKLSEILNEDSPEDTPAGA